MAASHMFPVIGLLQQRFSEEIETFAASYVLSCSAIPVRAE